VASACLLVEGELSGVNPATTTTQEQEKKTVSFQQQETSMFLVNLDAST
jgi:hypothetical protein